MASRKRLYPTSRGFFIFIPGFPPLSRGPQRSPPTVGRHSFYADLVLLRKAPPLLSPRATEHGPIVALTDGLGQERQLMAKRTEPSLRPVKRILMISSVASQCFRWMVFPSQYAICSAVLVSFSTMRWVFAGPGIVRSSSKWSLLSWRRGARS
jgi:hypothetical protein